MLVDVATNAGYDIIYIPETLKAKITVLKDISGQTIRGLEEFTQEYSKSFEYQWVDVRQLDSQEKTIWRYTEKIFDLIGGKPHPIRETKISETMKKDFTTFQGAKGIYQPHTKTIIIKRSQLKSLADYAGTLLHETAHATSREDDVSREFELELTRFLGLTAARAIKK